MSIEAVTEQIKQKFSYAPQINAKIKLDFGEDGLLFIDSTQTPPAISHDDKGGADVTLRCGMALFQEILNGTQDANIAFMMGKLKIEGSMGLAMKLNAILED